MDGADNNVPGEALQGLNTLDASWWIAVNAGFGVMLFRGAISQGAAAGQGAVARRRARTGDACSGPPRRPRRPVG